MLVRQHDIGEALSNRGANGAEVDTEVRDCCHIPFLPS